MAPTSSAAEDLLREDIDALLDRAGSVGVGDEDLRTGRGTTLRRPGR